LISISAIVSLLLVFSLVLFSCRLFLPGQQLLTTARLLIALRFLRFCEFFLASSSAGSLRTGVLFPIVLVARP